MILKRYSIIFLSDKQLGFKTKNKGKRFSIIINDPMEDGFAVVIHTTTQRKDNKNITQFPLVMNEKSLITVQQTIAIISLEDARKARELNKEWFLMDEDIAKIDYYFSEIINKNNGETYGK